MRAREPDRAGYVERDGVKLHYEVFGAGNAPSVVLLPTWSIVHSRHWKMQVPYLSRFFEVVTFDGRGNGLSDRPASPAAYEVPEFAGDTLAVMDELGVERATLVGLSRGALWGTLLAAGQPERVDGLVLIGPALALGPSHLLDAMTRFGEHLSGDEPWHRYNAHAWRSDYPGFLRFFFGQMFCEPHSTKAIEDCVGWGLETTPETLIDTAGGAANSFVGEQVREFLIALCESVRCPVSVITGDDDRITAHGWATEAAERLRAELLVVSGGGHGPHVRHPVVVNRAIRAFVERTATGRPPPTRREWRSHPRRPRRVLYLSSPIGLGHARRDVAIAEELQQLCPQAQIEWLAQDPVTRVLEAKGAHIHGASRFLANESSHIESESHEHDLHAFEAIRRMDEILLANFMVLQDVLDDEHFDLVVADEAWDYDHYLHENPELKRSAVAWLTDFVGWLPMPEGGPREALLTADYNAEMIEHIDRFPRVRDRAIFVGDPDDVVGDTFGPDLPGIRSWTEEHFTFSGYVTGFEPMDADERAATREALGWAPDERVCLATVGGSGVGGGLLRTVLAAWPEARRRVDGLRLVVVTGPRIDPASLGVSEGDGLELRAFVPDLFRQLGACDIAMVQGGLTTCMELTANRRPFLYFPLQSHFEQQFHVRHRLNRYGAGRCLQFGQVGPEEIADALASELATQSGPDYLPVPADGARRAAELIAELI